MDIWHRLADIRVLIACGSFLAVAIVTIVILYRPRKLKLFINYRKDDTDDRPYRLEHNTSQEVRTITNVLREILGDQHLEKGKTGPVRDGEVFLDVDDIPPGADWREFIKSQHHQSAVLVCLIGKQWLTLAIDGVPRLFRTGDIVREELEAAFQQGMEVVPVLVNGAAAPSKEKLPSRLTDWGFHHRHWIEIDTRSPDLQTKIAGLVASIRQLVKNADRNERRAALIDLASYAAAPLLVLWSLLFFIPPTWFAPEILAILGFFGTLLVLPLIGSWSMLKLIHDTRCREPDFNWLTAYAELLFCYLRSLGRRTVERVARVRVEAAVVHVPPEEPVPDDDPDRRLQNRIEYRQEQANRQRSLNKAAANALGIARGQDAVGIHPEIACETCFDLHSATKELKRYLTVLHQRQRGSKTEASNQFLSRIRIKQGFISPQFLTTGLMDTFDENWRPVLDWYGEAVEAECPPQVAKSLQRVQVFEFLCWLTWGPSVPHCQCEQWKSHYPEKTGGVFLQFGYGDENNSFLMCDDEGTAESLRSFLDKALKTEPNARAFQCVATVRPVLLSEVKYATCKAQEDAVEQSGVALRSTKIEPFTGNATQVGRRIYQAYVWMMFVLCDRDGQPLFPEAPWRGLLPFFTHGNIAEPDTYRFIRQEVARKSLEAIRSLHAGSPEVTFRFACSSDVSNCGDELAFPPAKPTMLEFFTDELRTRLSEEEQTCVILPDVDRPDRAAYRNIYASCHLPERLRDFYADLERKAGKAEPGDPSLNAVNVS